jgi:hypothetical protein
MITSNVDFQNGMNKVLDKISQCVENMLKKVKEYKKEIKRNKKSGKSKEKLTIDREG